MRNRAPISPGRAVFRGHLIATVPALVLLVAIFIFSAHWVAQPLLAAPPSFRGYFTRLAMVSIAGLAAGWLWWSVAILRWKTWARARGANEEAIQRLGQKTLLLWPTDSALRKQ